jgi:adenosine deaminase
MESIRHKPGELLLFLRDMPKGADLHNHLSGSIYAESLIKWAGEDGLCLVRLELRLKEPPCSKRRGEIPAVGIARDAKLYGEVIDAWSMRNWDPARRSGHDQFFESFGKFSAATGRRTGHMLAEVAQRAASQNISYMELMHSPDQGSVIGLGMSVGFDMDFGRLRNRLIARGLRDTLTRARGKLDNAELVQSRLMQCGISPRPAACDVTVRYLYQVLRGLPPQAVFAQILAGFEMSRLEPRMVGFNLVMPEDAPVPMRDFSLHMRMIDYLHSLYPDVKITLHAGELADGLVPPEGMRFHIRESVMRGHARRIGHGTAVLNETAPVELLRHMAEKRILVEIALSSSDAILGIKGKNHPMSVYLKHGVPVALATDDEGVLRSNLTMDYRRAVEEQGVDYRTLKQLARNSILYAFVDDGTKSRLINRLESAFTRFEERYAVAGNGR